MELVLAYWPWFTVVAAIALAIVVSGHIVFFKRDARAALAWIAILWFMPIVGVLLYFLFGINRIERRARRLRRRARRPKSLADATGTLPEARSPTLPNEAAHLEALVQVSETVTGQPLCDGNTIVPLWDGDQAYPAMLQAIDEAQHSVALSMYIFNNDITGNRFVEALGRAVARGVEVRVLIDDLGARHFFWRSISGPLQRACGRAGGAVSAHVLAALLRLCESPQPS